MGRVSRVEPAAVRHAGGERSAQHRFPRGAAGIDKGSAAASLVPFTAPVIKTFHPTPGERNPSTHAICQAHCRMARYTLIRPTGTALVCMPPSGSRCRGINARERSSLNSPMPAHLCGSRWQQHTAPPASGKSPARRRNCTPPADPQR